MSSDDGWKTVQKGNVTESVHISGNDIWLRVDANIGSSSDTAKFFYSLDGLKFNPLGDTHEMANGAIFFVGDRYGIFNFATKELGGQVIFQSFTISS